MDKIQTSVLLVTLLIISGIIISVNANCSGLPGKSEWELEVWISEENQLENSTVVLQGEVSTSGYVTGTTIEDVHVVFIDDEIDASESVDIGTLTEYAQQNLTVRLAFVPDIVRIETADIQTGDDTKYWIKGVERDRDGQYEQFVQTERTC